MDIDMSTVHGYGIRGRSTTNRTRSGTDITKPKNGYMVFLCPREQRTTPQIRIIGTDESKAREAYRKSKVQRRHLVEPSHPEEKAREGEACRGRAHMRGTKKAIQNGNGTAI
jgi:hypothetical protein